MVMSCMPAKQCARRNDLLPHEVLVCLVSRPVKDQLDPANVFLRWIQVWFCFVFVDANRSREVEQPLGLWHVSVANAFVVRGPRESFADEGARQSHDRRLILEAVRVFCSLT